MVPSEDSFFLAQGVDYLGFLESKLRDLRGFSALAYELLQNADDAKDQFGRPAATEVVFDVTDEALIIGNDGLFTDCGHVREGKCPWLDTKRHKCDFHRFRQVAGGDKREEEDTIGAFGIGFISVYQITDRPELISTGWHWMIRPERPEDERIQARRVETGRGTRFRFPWAFDQNSEVRRRLRLEPVKSVSLDQWTDELCDALPASILFLRNISTLEIRRNGAAKKQLDRVLDGDQAIVSDGIGPDRIWTLIRGDFQERADILKAEYPAIERRRPCTVAIAVPHSGMERGLLFAYLPTKYETGLSFHVNAAFFPSSDRKSIIFDGDYQTEWNRAAIQAAAEALALNFGKVRDRLYYRNVWSIIGEVWQTAKEAESRRKDPSLKAFRDQLSEHLMRMNIVYTTGQQWVTPDRARYLEGQEEEEASLLLESLGIPIVHSTLRLYQNILTSKELGVDKLGLPDLIRALEGAGMGDSIAGMSFLPEGFRSTDGLRLLWRQVGRLMRRTRNPAEEERFQERVCRLPLALAQDGELHPCREVYRADPGTVELFSTLMPQLAFIGDMLPDGEAVADLCREFDSLAGIEAFEQLETGQVGEAFGDNGVEPGRLIRWFEARKHEFIGDGDVADRLRALPVFPAGTGLRPLDELSIPGNFSDPLGLADVVDMSALAGLRDFLTDLGAKELTFQTYVRDHVSRAFSKEIELDAETKGRLVHLLARRQGEIRDDNQAKEVLASAAIIECTDGHFREAASVYFDNEETETILGNSVSFAKIPDSERNSVVEFCRWLGVAERARARDVIAKIRATVSQPPSDQSRKMLEQVFGFLGNKFEERDEEEKRQYSALRHLEWLPAENIATNPLWYRPAQVYASYSKYLFETQGLFLAISAVVQNRSRSLIDFLEIPINPTPFQVVAHLLAMAEKDLPVNQEVYTFLNNNASAPEVPKLIGTRCLRIGDKYVRPDQVFWERHPFGRFRFQKGHELRRYGDLLSRLRVREHPEVEDAFALIEEISVAYGDEPLEDSRDVVMQCWRIISDALRDEEITPQEIENWSLIHSTIPDGQAVLQSAQWVLFDDRPGLAAKFGEALVRYIIPRPKGAWGAMEEAGVRGLSLAVTCEMVDSSQCYPDLELEERVRDRQDLIERIIDTLDDGASRTDLGILSRLSFAETSSLKLVWTVRLPQGNKSTEPEPALAHLSRDDRVVYFCRDSEDRPWSALAREISAALCPGTEVGRIAPGIKAVIGAKTKKSAIAELGELGIAEVEALHVQDSDGEGPRVDALGKGSSIKPVAQRVSSTEEDQRQHVNFQQEEIKLDGKGKAGGETQERSQQRTGEVPPEEAVPGKQELEAGRPSFAKALLARQVKDPARAREIPVQLPIGGPRTEESAEEDNQRTEIYGRTGEYVTRAVTRWTPSEVAQEIAERFVHMVKGDYVSRCQICSNSFQTASGVNQVFVVHLLEPQAHYMTNHFGNLVGICGWHYALLKYGQWALPSPSTGEAPSKIQEMLGNFAEAGDKVRTDEFGSEYVALPIRFWNVYTAWDPEPRNIDEEIRFSMPHWAYVEKLVCTDEDQDDEP